MNLTDQRILNRPSAGISSEYHRDFSHNSDNMSINSASSFSDEGNIVDSSSGDNISGDHNKKDSIESNQKRLSRELATVFAANSLLGQNGERETSRPKKKNVYVQPHRVKHSSGGSNHSNEGSHSNSHGKVATAWRKITDKFGSKSAKTPVGKLAGEDAWRRFSLDVSQPSIDENGDSEANGTTGKDDRRRGSLSMAKPQYLNRLLSLDRSNGGEDGPHHEHRPFRPRSNSEVCHFRIVSKNADVADFTVTAPSKLADASALCQEYFSRLTCYEAVPCITSVIAVDKVVPISKVFNIFCDNQATAIILWDSDLHWTKGACHVDELVCGLYSKARERGIETLFDAETDFGRPLMEICSGSVLRSVPADMSLMEAAKLLCTTPDNDRSKRLALIKGSDEIVHLLSAWDILHFFSRQVGKFHAAHTAFDLTLSSILASSPQPPADQKQQEVEVLPEEKLLKEVIESLAAKGGGSAVVRSELANGKRTLSTLSFVDIIQYVVQVHGSWNDAEETDKTLGHVLKYYKMKDSLVYTSNTPLFAVLQDWTPAMTADTPVVVVSDPSMQTVLGVLEPEHLLQALLLDAAAAISASVISNESNEHDEESDHDNEEAKKRRRSDVPISTRL